MEDNIQSVYNKLVSYGYEGTEDDFRNYISDDANIQSVYDKFVSKGYQGTEDDFRGYIGMPSQAQQPAQRVDVSDVEKADQPFVPTMEPEDMQTPSAPVGQMQQIGQPANVGDDTMMRMHRAGKPNWSGYQQQQYEKVAGEVNAKYGIPTKLSTENYDVVSQRLANLDKEYDRIAERQSIFVDDDIEPSWVARDNARLASLNEERDALRAYKTAFGTTDERQSYEQRVGSVFDEIDKEGVAERAWDNAEKRTAEAQADEPYNVAGIFNMGVEKLKYHDLQRMADEAWNMLGAEKQQEITGKLYDVLKEYYPDADEQSLREGAEKMARQQSNQRVFDVAVENNAPKSALDQFFRKAVGMNSVVRIVEGMERKAAGTTGDWEAREVAEQEFDNGWHKVVGIGGTVTGFLFDPIARVSGGAGGALAKGGVSLLERAAGAAVTRKFATTLGGRALTGALAGAGNLGTYEAANEAVDQFRWGGTRLQDPETGRYIIGDYSGGQVLKSLGHGALMGSTTGIIAPMIGNVSDKLVNATGSTAGKTALRTGELALGTVAEGTVFSIPEFVNTYIEYGDAIAALSDENSPAYIADEAERSKAIEELVSKRKGAMMDVWTDNMAVMAGFKAQHILKSAPQRIAELRSSGRGKAGLETRLRDMLDGKEGLGLTEDEKRELNRSGYGDLNNLVDEYQDYVKSRKNQTVRPDRLLQDGGGELGDIPYNRFEQLMGDQSVSESARAKMYYYITGNVLPMSTVTGSTFTEVKDPSGNVVGYQVQSMGNNGVITSKTFKNEKAARVEENKILRQVELNAIDGGERWFDNTSEMRGGEHKTSKDVRSDLFNKYYVDVDKAIEKEPTRRSKVEQQAVDEYIKTLWGDVIQEQKAEERQHQETKAEMLKLKAASEGLAEDLMTEDDPTTLKSAGRDMRDARRALSEKIGEERMQALENMDEDQLATAYSEADADTQTLMKKWLISSDQEAVAEGISQRSVSAVGQFKEEITSFFENNAASGKEQRSKLADGIITLVDVDGNSYIVVGTHGRMYTVKDVNGNAKMVDASQVKNERDVSFDQFVLEQKSSDIEMYAALAEAFYGTDFTPGQVVEVGEGNRGKAVMVIGVDGENVTYAADYTVGKDGQVNVLAERTVPKQQFRDMVEQWEKRAAEKAKRQAELTNVPVSQMEDGMTFPVEWRGNIVTAEVVEEGGKKSVNLMDNTGKVIEKGIDDFTDEDWQAIRVVVPEQEKDIVDQSQKSNIGVGDVVSYNGEVGGALSGTVVDVKDNGLVTFETPDGDRYTKWRSLLKVEQPVVDETPAEVKPEQENKPVEIPRTESGDIAHSLLDVNDKETYDAAVREEVENALAFAKDGDASYVENNLAAAQAAVEEAEKKVPTAQGAAQRRAELETIGNERAAARNLVDFWKEVSKEKSKKVWEDLQNPKEVSNFAADPEKQQEWVDSHQDDIINGYVATYGNKLDPDELRKAFRPIGYDGSNVEEFRDQEIRLRDDLYGRMLKAAVDSGNPSITILTGVGGAGKSTATQNMDLSGRGLVFDAALNKPKKLAAAIKKAKDAGMKDIQVVAVKNDAPTAFENTLRRGLSEGRFLPLEYFTKSYQDNQGKIAEIRERYPDVEIVSYDNSGNNGRGVTIDEASNWDYTIDDETLSKLLDIYENGIDQGRFTADQAAAIGRGLSEITWSRGSRAAELDRRISRIERRIRQAGDGLLRSEVSAQRSGSGRRDLGSAALGNEGYGGSNQRPVGQGSGAEGIGYVARFDNLEREAVDARLSGDTERLSQLNGEKAAVIQEYLDSIKTDDAYVLTADNYESVLKANEVKEEDIQQVRDMYEYTRREHKRMGGFNIDGKIYVFADDVRSIDDARSTYVHERQHNINDKDVYLLRDVKAAAGRDELLLYVQALSGTHAYDNKTQTTLADEFVSMAMEVAYRTDDVETALREMGIENDELINIIKRLDDEQRTSDSLANARRNTYVDNNGQGSGRLDGTDQGRRPTEVGEQGLRPDEGGRQEAEGVRVSDEGVTSISDAAEKEGSGIEVGGDTRFNIATEPQLQRQIKDYVKTRDAKNAGWTEDKVNAVVSETEDLIKAIDNALSGEKFYKEWSGKMPTIKVDWRDGEEKPTVTWTRGNIDYKYDMSADLLCINNEGMEGVLSSPTMVDLMLAMQKGKKGFTSDDYMTLYNTLDDLGFVVPCKGCFDAAARFKMLPSTSQKFVDLVNETIDRRNKDKEAFDNMLRARAAKSGSALPNGLPSSAKNKEEAVEIGVAGDDLTEHITWTQLMSAAGQTKALYDWGGVFRAWQRTGAGRPKDKLLPEPYSGDIMSPFATIVAPYGEKTPSFREYEVNVGTGLRRNSHSEFRPILAVDEIQFMRDAYIRNLMVFKYMKELDDVRLFGKMGVKFNMSFFPAFVDGTPAAGLDKDGNYIASEESVGSREFEYVGEDGRKHYDGMKGFEEAQKYVNDNVSLSSVVFSVPHLIKAFTDVPTPSDKSGVWGLLIPFHNSGAVKSQIKKQGLGDERAASPKDNFETEAMTDYDKGVTNFEQVQNDRFGEGWVIVEGKKKGTAVEPGHKLEFANGTHYYNERLGLHLFNSFYIYDNEIPSDMELVDGKYSKADLKKLGHEYSIDYNDKVRELNSEYGYKEATDEYVDFLRSIGLVPRFDFTVPEATFLEMCERAKVDPRHPKLGWKGEGNDWSPADAESYYSLWCDYGMTDPATGKWSPHRPVGYIDENGERSFRMPDNTLDIVKEGVARYSERKRTEEGRVNEAITEFTRRSVDAGKLSEEEAERILGEAGIRFSVKDDESQAIYDKAKDIFGTTSDIREAGYILPDGEMLDFSGRNSLDKGVDDSFLRGRRTADHRDISNVNYEKDGNTPSGLKTDMPDFIRRGAIRIDSNAGVINLSVKPTKQQRWPIRRVVEANDGDVQVDFGDGWDSDHYVEYEGAKPSRVLADIDRYFDEGIKPEGNVRFRVTDQQDADYMYAVNRGDMETAQRMVNEAAKAAMPNTKVVDENGNPLVVYHGRSEQFNTFERRKGVRFVMGLEDEVESEGFFFTPDKDFAEQYAANAERRRGGRRETIPTFLNIENPLDLAFTDNFAQLYEEVTGYEYQLGMDDITNLWEIMDIEGMADKIKAKGYDGVIFAEEKAEDGTVTEYSYCVFDPNQIKSADPVTYDDQGNVIPLSERFNEEKDDIRFSVSNDNQEIFVSNAARAVEGIKQEKATPEQWLKMIEKGGGLKAGEDKWIGLSDWLKEQKGSLTKKDVLDFIKQNAIKIEEVRYSDDATAGKDIFKYNPHAQERFNEMQDEYKRILADEKEKNGDTWVAYVKASDRLDEKYPNSSVAYDTDDDGNLKVKLGMEKKALEALGLEADNPINATRLKYTTEGLDNKKEIALVVPTVEPWNEGDKVHFGDAGEGRAVAWIRFGDTTDDDGKRVLVIDEIQSKRHQDARENGYKTTVDEADKDFYDFIARTKEKYHYTSTTPLKSVFTDEEMKEYNRLNRRLSDAYNDEGIPEAPFEKNWHELAMKRMLRYAAENGYDKVAWTKGEQQAKRYDLSKVIGNITRKDAANSKDKGIRKFNINLNGKDESVYVNNDGIVVGNTIDMFQDNISGKPLSDLVGKEIADHMMTMEDGTTTHTGDIQVGGEGMKGFYDRMLPSFMDKYGKKWGVKTQEVTLPNLENAGSKMWAVDVTDQMKDDVMDGQVMFSIIGEKGSANDETAMANLEIAKQMEKEGKDAKAMWLATGWEKGKDGKWRREIPDLKKKDIDPKSAKTVGELIDAPELFEAYPQLKDLKIKFKKLKGLGGQYTDADKSITLDTYYTTDVVIPEEFMDIARQKMKEWHDNTSDITGDKIKSQYRKLRNSLGRRTLTKFGEGVLEHELQHAIQRIEGFAYGGNSSAMAKDYVENQYKGDPELLNFAKYWSSGNSAQRLIAFGKRRMADAVRNNLNVLPESERQTALEMADKFEVMSDAEYNRFVRNARDLWALIKKEGKEGYRNLVGEVEARNAEKRRSMSEEERRSTPLYETEDVPRNKQIVRGADASTFAGMETDEPIDEKYDAGVLSRKEMLAETLLNLANRNKEDRQAKMDAIKALTTALNETMKASDNKKFDIAMQDRSVASAQRGYDKATVDSIVRLARLMSSSDMFKDFSRGEVNRLLSLVKNANGRNDISKQANKVADMMLQHAVREMDDIMKKQLNVKGAKTNAQGVMEQGRLDLQGQRMVDAMKRGMELDDASLQELIDEANDGMGSDNESTAANAAVDYQGYMLAKQYIDDIKASKAEEDRMRDDIAKKEQEVKEGTLDRKAYNEFVAETERAIRENKAQRVNAYGRLLTSIGQDIRDSFGRAKAFRDAQIEHVNDIHHNANSDLEGVPSSEHSTADNKLLNSSAARFLLRPVADFDEMMRFLGRKSADGKGYLFNRFIPAFTKASDMEHKNRYNDHKELDRKVSEVFGKKMRWSDLFAVEGSLPSINVKFRDGGEMKDHKLTQGKALYIYMVNKMTDGRMKLRAMGITEDDVQAIKDQLDPRFIELADWVQGEFLPKLRERYNEVHTRMFGAPMDAIEDYFRLEVNDRSRGREMDISAPESDMKPSTVTGSIKKRVKNSTALDLTNTDAFDMLLGNIDEMEHWAAFAEFNRDINILLSYNKFRNRVMNMTSGRFGSGETLWNNLVDTARIVAGVYQPKVRAKDLDNALVNMSKGVTAAKISFRLYTALKQLLSYPAYLSEANPVELVKSSNPVGAVKSWNWAMENLPGFSKRWQSRQAGDTRLKETDVDWQLWKNKIIETAGRLGMTPNAFVDAMTVAMGSKAVYETALNRYMKDGYSKDAAEEKAKMDASLAYNETQQSSEGAYVSGMQLDRTLASVALTVFRNASMAYERRFMRALSNMKKMSRKGFKEENMEFTKKQMMRDGLTEEQAEEAAKRSYRRAWAKSAADVAIFGWVLQFAWNLGSDLMYLLFGKDDDMKEEMLKDAALHAVAGGVEGLSGGSIMSEYYNTMRKRKEYEEKYGKAPSGQKSELNLTTLPIMSDIKTTMQHFDQDDVRGINDIVNLVIQAGVGVNPQTITDAVVAIVDAANGDMETGKEIGMLMMRLAQVPQSQVDNIYIDELGMTAKDAKNLDVDAMAKRYARYKNRRDTFFTGWMYDEGEREKAEERYAKRFDKKIQERIQAMDDDEVTDALENANPEMKEKFNKEYASRQGITYTKSSTEYGKVYDKLVTPKDISEDAVLKQAKKDAKETGDDRLYKEIDSFQRQLTNIKKGASYHIGDVKVSDEDSPGLGKSEKSDESVMRNIRKQRERFLKRHGLISGEEE